MRVRYIYSSRHTKTIDPHNRHKQAVPHIVKEVIRISDVVLEILDARYIEETRHPELEEHVRELGKKLVFVLNKADLVNVKELKESGKLKDLMPYVFFSAPGKIGKRELRRRISIEAKRMNKGHKKAHVGIFGYPNTGKSSLINYLSGRGVAGISSQAGFTKGMQKIRLTKDTLLLDTPGIIPLKEDKGGAESGFAKHSKIGVDTYDRVKEPDLVIHQLMQENADLLKRYYQVDTNDSEELLLKLGERWKFLKKGGEIDADRAARQVLKDWQLGKIKKNG